MNRWVVLLLLAVWGIYHLSDWIMVFSKNIGYVQLNWAMGGRGVALEDAERPFLWAVAGDSATQSAWRGLGMVWAQQGNYSQAGLAWERAGETPEHLLVLGQQAQARKEYLLAFTWYEQLMQFDDPKGWNYFAALVQLLQWQSPEHLPTGLHTYEEFVAWNGGNWLVNGGYELQTVGWLVYQPDGSEATYEVVDDEGRWHGVITGKTADYHGGWLQPIQLQPGGVYQFSADIQVVGDPQITADILYWEIAQEGVPQGQQATRVQGHTPWQTFRIQFVSPSSDNNVILFYPVRVTGPGSVWIDNVHLIQLAAP